MPVVLEQKTHMRSGRFEGVDTLVSGPFPFEVSAVGSIFKILGLASLEREAIFF